MRTEWKVDARTGDHVLYQEGRAISRIDAFLAQDILGDHIITGGRTPSLDEFKRQAEMTSLGTNA